MNKKNSYFVLLFLTAFVASCSSSDPLLLDPSLAPRLISTTPTNVAVNVALNTKILVAFNTKMAPSTINTTTFTLKQGASPVVGTVTSLDNLATFLPSASLTANTVYTATITTGASNLDGQTLTSNYVWTFTTGTTTDLVPPTTASTNPTSGSTGVCLQRSINVTFSKPMDPATITATTFIVTGPSLASVVGAVSYDPNTNIASFQPTSNLAASTAYNATVKGGVNGAKDLSGNALASDQVWSFTTGTQSCPVVASTISLGAAATFGSSGGGAGMTNQGLLTVINGNIATTGASTTVTGFHDRAGNVYTETPLNIGAVNGAIYTAPPAPGNSSTFNIATSALAAAQNAWSNTLSPAGLPGGTDPGAGQLGGLTLNPGIYQAASGSFLITGSDLTLDGQGDSNAVWVFQTASTLTVGAPGAPRSVILINGAQAKNVYWRVGSAATINAAGGGTMVGTIIADSGVTFSTAGVTTLTTLNGRALGLHASVTMVNTVINVPAP